MTWEMRIDLYNVLRGSMSISLPLNKRNQQLRGYQEQILKQGT